MMFYLTNVIHSLDYYCLSAPDTYLETVRERQHLCKIQLFINLAEKNVFFA